MDAAAPGPITSRAVDALRIAAGSRVWVIAVGKAAPAMTAAATASLLRSRQVIAGGVIISPEDEPAPYPAIAVLRGDHPIPGRHSFAAAAKLADVAGGRRGQDVALVLLSGGASSLMGAPIRGMNESDFTSLYELLLGAGLDIAAMNTVRKRFARWGAGRLALALAPAATLCLAISDVAGDDLGVIGSGPCAPDPATAADVDALLQRAGLAARIPQTQRDYLTAVQRGTIPETPKPAHPAFAHVTSRVIGNNRLAIDGAAAAAKALGLDVHVMPAWLSGEASQAGDTIARELIAARTSRADDANGAPSACFLWGGETTVTVGRGGQSGKSASGGGRCQELALAAARTLHDAGAAANGITILAAGTDGRDGATDAAGAVVDVTTWNAIATAGRDPAHGLATHESYGALAAAGALIPRRETGTNVNDVVVGLV